MSSSTALRKRGARAGGGMMVRKMIKVPAVCLTAAVVYVADAAVG